MPDLEAAVLDQAAILDDAGGCDLVPACGAVEAGPEDGAAVVVGAAGAGTTAAIALGFKAIRSLYPDYPIWRGKDFKYEYTDDVLAIDVINGGPALREWVDDVAAAPADLDVLTQPDEAAWDAVRALWLY